MPVAAIPSPAANATRFIVDCTQLVCNPYPGNWIIIPDNEQMPNRVTGRIDIRKLSLPPYVSQHQGKLHSMPGHQLQKELESLRQHVLSAHVLDRFLSDESLIPPQFKQWCQDVEDRKISFWGTLYRCGKNLVIRNIGLNYAEEWNEEFQIVSNPWRSDNGAGLAP